MSRNMDVTLYVHDGEWCYALRIDGEYDHHDGLGVRQSEGFAAAVEALREQLVDLPQGAEWSAGRLGELQTEWVRAS